MEKKVLKHIVKTLKKENFKEMGDILELYGPLNYKEYDEVIKFIDKEQIKNDKNGTLGRLLVGDHN
jgi:imidazole glycerol phosphate synthase subunit HisF|tara:strand:+ start:1394 stop:1591 length:198 start_codon:yes stop_codon:yes gene_type:complete